MKPNDIDVTILDGNSQVADADVVISLRGDYNRDLVVDASDYVVWKQFPRFDRRRHFADGNFDGIVDAADYTIWRDNFGLSLPATGTGADEFGRRRLAAGGVPEPAAVLLLLLAGGGGALLATRERQFGVS